MLFQFGSDPILEHIYTTLCTYLRFFEDIKSPACFLEESSFYLVFRVRFELLNQVHHNPLNILKQYEYQHGGRLLSLLLQWHHISGLSGTTKVVLLYE